MTHMTHIRVLIVRVLIVCKQIISTLTVCMRTGRQAILL